MFICSCNDDLSQTEGPGRIEEVVDLSLKMERFSEILSIAVSENPDLRTFIKSEALEMVDNDYDVFYPLCKDEIVSDGKSFREILKSYAHDENELTELEESLPLLTIYVPELPSGFNAETWNALDEIPFIVPNVVKQDSVPFYELGAVKFSIKSDLIPGFPVLVVKNNERIQKDATSLKSSSSDSESSVCNGYHFIDKAFDGNKSELKSVGVVTAANYLDYLKTAYTEMGADGYYWQRDNIYYGLTKTATEGRLNRRLVETICYVKFSPSAYYKMSDQTGDPALTNQQVWKRDPLIPSLFWTEGRFEIRIDVYVNNISGLGTVLTKYFSASGNELFDYTYERYSPNSIFIPYDLYTSKLKSGKDYYPTNLKLITWDLASNGSSWKYAISEVDNAETVTTSSTVTSEFAANASMDTKFGLKFGASAKRTVSNSYTNVISLSSDDLGTLESNFSDPVALTLPSRHEVLPLFDYFMLYTMSNPMVEMGVVPLPLY